MLGNAPHLLRQFNYASGLTDRQELATLPTRAPDGRQYYVRGFYFELKLNLTSASTSDAITAKAMLDMIREISIVDNAGRRFLFDTPVGLNILAIIETYLRNKRSQALATTAISANSNTTNTPTLKVFIPLEQVMLADRKVCLQPAAALNHGVMTVRWSGSGLGTGQTINASTRLRVYADLVARDTFDHRAELFIGVKVPSTFSGDRVPLNGLVALFGVGVEDGSAGSSTIASNDFTDYGLEGRDLSVARGTDIDVPANLFNLHVPDKDAEITIPSTGTITHFPLVFPTQGAQLSDMAYEDQLVTYLTAGAGAPAVTDQSFFYAVIRPRNVPGLAAALGATQAVKGNGGEWSKVLASANAADGRGMQGGVPRGHRLHAFLPVPINTTFRGT